MEAQDLMKAKIDSPGYRQCEGTSKQSGKRCLRRATPGTNVCIIHGSGAPQVKLKARERLDQLVLPAIKVLADAMKTNDINAQLRAAQLVLDRSGFGPKSDINLGGELNTNQKTTIDLKQLSAETLKQIRAEMED